MDKNDDAFDRFWRQALKQPGDPCDGPPDTMVSAHIDSVGVIVTIQIGNRPGRKPRLGLDQPPVGDTCAD